MWIIRGPSGGAPKWNGPGGVSRRQGHWHKESACKPGSVESNHSSGTCVAAGLEQPTRKARGPRVGCLRIRPSLFGLAPDGVCHAASGYPSRGALLPHHFTLASALRRFGGLLSVALSVGSRRPDVIWRPARWSPDFPPRPFPAFAGMTGRSGCSANSAADSSALSIGSEPIEVSAPASGVSQSALTRLIFRRPHRARRDARRPRTAPCAAARSARPRAWRPSTRRAP